MHWTHTGTSRVATNKNAPHCCEAFGAENETRTRDPDLGKVVLYQLSYFRKMSKTFSWNGTAKIRQKNESPNFFSFFACRDSFFGLMLVSMGAEKFAENRKKR